MPNKRADNMTCHGFYDDRDVIKALKEEAHEKGISYNELMRQIVREHFHHEQNKHDQDRDRGVPRGRDEGP
jgi:hypothetical protein